MLEAHLSVRTVSKLDNQGQASTFLSFCPMKNNIKALHFSIKPENDLEILFHIIYTQYSRWLETEVGNLTAGKAANLGNFFNNNKIVNSSKKSANKKNSFWCAILNAKTWNGLKISSIGKKRTFKTKLFNIKIFKNHNFSARVKEIHSKNLSTSSRETKKLSDPNSNQEWRHSWRHMIIRALNASKFNSVRNKELATQERRKGTYWLEFYAKMCFSYLSKPLCSVNSTWFPIIFFKLNFKCSLTTFPECNRFWDE